MKGGREGDTRDLWGGGHHIHYNAQQVSLGVPTLASTGCGVQNFF